jgi:hypothetical protein
MNHLSREKQIEIIAALCEGVGQRAVTRLTGADRKTIARLALRVGRGCAELHDRLTNTGATVDEKVARNKARDVADPIGGLRKKHNAVPPLRKTQLRCNPAEPIALPSFGDVFLVSAEKLETST